MKHNPGRKDADTAMQTRKNILIAAAQQFASRGFKGASLREISMLAETSHGLIRHHFGTKEALWKAVVDEHIQRMSEKHLPLFTQVEHIKSVDLLKEFARNYILQSAEHPEIMQLLIKDCSEPGPYLNYLIEGMLPIHTAISSIFKQAQKEGYFLEHNSESFFISLISLGSFPFTVSNFVNKFYDTDINSNDGIKAHIEMTLSTLFDRQQ